MARPENGLRGFDPSESDAVKGKGSERVGKEEREGSEATRSPMGGTRATDVAWMKSERACHVHSGLWNTKEHLEIWT